MEVTIITTDSRYVSSNCSHPALSASLGAWAAKLPIERLRAWRCPWYHDFTALQATHLAILQPFLCLILAVYTSLLLQA